MAQERKFAKKLNQQSAANVRGKVSEAVRESTSKSRPKLVDPVDYETVIVKNKTILHNDPQRDMLVFPYDDVSMSTLPRRFRTVRCSVPTHAVQEATRLLVRECIKTYTSNWTVIHYKYSSFSGGFHQLPNLPSLDATTAAPVFEVDAELDTAAEEESAAAQRARNVHVTKQGWLYKGPDNSGNDTSFISFTRSFKRRYFYLKQQADTTYVMEFHKDDKKLDAKGTIFLDSAVKVAKSQRRGKHIFELNMQDDRVYVFAAESDGDLEGWVAALTKVISTNDSGSHPPPSLGGLTRDDSFKSENFQASLEHSMNPQLQKYARETDSLLTTQRKENRQKLFVIYPEVQKAINSAKHSEEDSKGHDHEVYKEHFGTRFIVKCEHFKLRLQADVSEDGRETLRNPEPFFISLCLYDAKEGKKISEDFHFDPNAEEIRAMVPDELKYNAHAASEMNGGVSNGMNGTSHSDVPGIDNNWMAFPSMAVFSVTVPHPDIYLVARIDKVLQGSVVSSSEPYVRTPDHKVGTKIYRSMQQYCTRLGHYRMPFAWGARKIFRSCHRDSIHSYDSESGYRDSERPAFKPFTVELDTYSAFALYRAEANKVSEEELIKHLQDIKKPEKQGKWQQILGELKVNMYTFKQTLANTVSSTLVPVKPFPDPPELQPTVEVEEFSPGVGKYSNPYTTYTNILYVYPKMLKFDSQKSFTKARNIACYVEVRDSDSDDPTPLKCLRARPGYHLFTTAASTTVLHHCTTPDFYDEVKVRLPTQLTDRHHLFFTFYHVSCDLAKSASVAKSSKRLQAIESVVGHAWLPLLDQGRVQDGEQSIRVSMNAPSGYLYHETPGLSGRGSTGPDLRWVDGGRRIFSFKLSLVSTTYTKCQHLHNFFTHCEKLHEQPAVTDPAVDAHTVNRLKASPPAAETGSAPGSPPKEPLSPYYIELRKYVKSLLAVDISVLISFLPTLFNQILRLLTAAAPEVAENAVRVLVHCVKEVHNVGRDDILHTYVKYVFMTEVAASTRHKTVHEELARHLKNMLNPTNTDQLVVGKFMRHSWFFFEVIIKSMAQHLLSTGRIKMARNERFPSSFQYNLQTMIQVLISHITIKYKGESEETRNANANLAKFIKKCITFMDRGFVFRLINNYIEKFTGGDPKILHEFKFEFLQIVCEHEHFIPLNLPLMRKTTKNYKASPLVTRRQQQATFLGGLCTDLKHDYTLSDEFRKNHFLVGLLLQEVKSALNEIRDIRKFAIRTLRNLLAKHSFDERYSNKAQQARIASLYLPFLTVILENKHRLTPKDTTTLPSSLTNGGDAISVADSNASAPVRMGIGQFDSQVSLDRVTLTSNSSAASLPNNHANAAGQPRYQKDPSVFAMIAGQGSNGTSTLPHKLSSLPENLNPATGHLGSSGSLESNHSTVSTATLEQDKDSLKGSAGSGAHSLSQHSAGGNVPFTVRYDKLDSQEIKDLLICFIYIVKNLAEDVLLGWFNNSSEYDVLDFLEVMEISMQQFKYQGRKRITSLCIISNTNRAGSMPGKRMAPNRNGSMQSDHPPDSTAAPPPQNTLDALLRANMEAQLSSEVAMVILDVVSLYTNNFKDALQYNDGDSAVMHKVFDLYLLFLQNSQSETVQTHAFAALRAFINKFPKVLFVGEATMCGRLCYEILRCCNSRLKTTRSEACALMYLLMRSNFEWSKRKSFTRVHLQMIIAVSQLISDVVGLTNSRFIDSLSIINSYTTSDKAIEKTNFVLEVRDLTKRIRTVLMATAQMREHQNDPEMLVDLQYSLAKSYASTPELRKTWLDSMAKIHCRNENYSEAALCTIHIAALVAEYLKRRDEFPQGCEAFRQISPNVGLEESGMRDDAGMQDVQYTTEHLTDLLEDCARLLEKAERYELLGQLYRLIIPIYERRRDFQKLSSAYELLHRSYKKVVEVMTSGRRMLGSYYRVAFYGQSFFEDEHQKEYVYKEPKVTGLPEICDRLRKLYSDKFGKDNVKLIMDSNKVNSQDLDPKLAHIQVTHVVPYFDEKELEERRTDFEKNNNVNHFSYETPFTKAGKARGCVAEQYKRRTVLTTSHCFPYIKKRILVVYHQDQELTPIDCAIDEMKLKVEELDDVVNRATPDVKRLQLKLQGSVSVQVNAGPLAYAEAFLAPELISKYNKLKVDTLKELFRDFVSVCNHALELNGRLIGGDQIEYHESLRSNFREMAAKLSKLFDEQLLPDDQSSTQSTTSSLNSRGSQGHIFAAMSIGNNAISTV